MRTRWGHRVHQHVPPGATVDEDEHELPDLARSALAGAAWGDKE